MPSSSVDPESSPWSGASLPGRDPVFLGRDALVEQLADRLTDDRPRAVVLTGLGGVGKSRLAAEVGARVAEVFGGRVAWIGLGPTAREGGLAGAIATALDLGDAEPDHAVDAVAAEIGDDPALLVLDAIEASLHDLGVVDELLAMAPAIRVLATSRIAAGRDGWAAVPVEPLEVPSETDSVERIAKNPAVELLVVRAEAAGADVPLTERTAHVIARLAGRLDGLPLAIELAAPLLRALPPHRLLDRIGERLDPVVATIDWSHEHLGADDRRLYRRLAVFGIPFRARHVRTFAERAVAHGLSPLGPDVAAGLERLAAAGLVRVRPDPSSGPDAASGPDDPRGGEVHEYELPALIREDAARRLEASGEATAAYWARANDLLALCELSNAELMTRSRADLLNQLDIVHDDLLSALDRARATGEGAFLLRMSGALAEYWRARGRLAEGRVRLDAALRLGPVTPTAERARALHGAGMLASAQSDYARSRPLFEEALRIRLDLGDLEDAAATLNQLGLIGLDTGDLDEAERHCRHGLEIRRGIGDEAAIAASLNTLGGVLQFGGRNEEAAELLAESVAIRRRLGDEAGVSVSIGNLALVARDRGDLDGAEAMLNESIATRERLGDRQRVAVVRHNLALVLFDRGDLDRAATELEAAVATARELGHRSEAANAMSDLGFVVAAAGDADRAARLQLDALALANRIGSPGIVAQSIDGIAGLVAKDGRPLDAAVLWAAAETIRRVTHYHLLLADRRRIDREIAAARDGADDEAWWRAWGGGEQLDQAEAVVRARASLDAGGVPARDGQVAV
ncbi:MAG TPA: tetratricopeptide repeat protein [Candidatus Limnocylindrales bacterium]|nr:tetratricopeptide repeat protein [Candidatus Limnocylindrales bacterium]